VNGILNEKPQLGLRSLSHCQKIGPRAGCTFHRSSPLGQMISSCPDYLHADVSDGEDVSRHQQEVTDGQLVYFNKNFNTNKTTHEVPEEKKEDSELPYVNICE